MKTIITDRKQMAEILYSGEYKVITFNEDTNEGSLLNVEYQTLNHGVLKKSGVLRRGKIKADDGLFYVLGSISMLTAKITTSEWEKRAAEANAPLLFKGDKVAVLVISPEKETSHIEVLTALKPTPEYGTILTFE